MEKTFKPLAKKDNIVVQDTENEVLVYDLNTNQAHCLNSTAAFVWQACDGRNSVDAISNALAEKSGKQVPQEVVWMAIEQLQEKDLVETVAVPVGTSRREAIKKAGLAAMIALPIVASLAAPKSVMASTSCICTTLADCSPQPGCPTTSCSGGVCQNAGPV